MMRSTFLEGGAVSRHPMKEFMLVVAYLIVPAEVSSGTMTLICPGHRNCFSLSLGHQSPPRGLPHVWRIVVVYHFG